MFRNPLHIVFLFVPGFFEIWRFYVQRIYSGFKDIEENEMVVF